MKHPILRIGFFVFTAMVIIAYPFIHDALSQPRKTEIRIAEGPVGGISFPIAGQEVDPAPEGTLQLRAPDSCEIGELVRLDVSESEVETFTWQIRPFTEDFEVIEDGRRAFFSARESSAGETFLVMIAGAKGGQSYLTWHEITVEGVKGPPAPETLATRVKRWADKVPDYEGRAAHRAALAGVFRKLASAEDTKVEDMLNATATANTAVLGDHLEDWIPFLEPLGEELDAYVSEDKLSTREQYAEVWNTIADGLEK